MRRLRFGRPNPRPSMTSPDHQQARCHPTKNPCENQAGHPSDVARTSGLRRQKSEARRMRDTDIYNCASCAGVIGTNSFSCKTIRLLPRMSCHHCRAEPSTIAATSTRKKTATNASNRQTPACRTNSAALAVSDIVDACSTNDRAPLKKPSLGSGEKTFKYPAEKVTAHMKPNGTSVTKIYFALCILIKSVVPRQSATTDSN